MEITKEKVEREGCYNFYLHKENQILKILFGGNLDLYWALYEYSETDKDLSLDEIQKEILEEKKYIFTITKENYFIYSLFEELYEDIKESRLFIPVKPIVLDEEEQDFSNIESDFDEDIDICNTMNEIEMQERNEWYKQRDYYKKLFDGETITWHSDDDEYSVADRVKIKKADDTFILEFIRPAINENIYLYRTPGCVSIRFRNSGSTYEPYNMIFMRMFNKLQAYNPEYHQLHIEEIIHHKKLSLKK